ncbi:MAG: glycosyl hydrolase [Ignavibacteriales bacterium]|nr:glycosyl hydrolase [Ignavibacteriales bacterium]
METQLLIKTIHFFPIILIAAAIIVSCDQSKKVLESKENYVTSEAGDKIAQKQNFTFKTGQAPKGNLIKINPEIIKQEIDGIGSSFTEASAFVLAHLDKKTRAEVMEKIFGETGANFSLTRTHIGSCDFCVEGKYSYLDKKGDTELTSFNIEPDKEGFNPDKYPGIQDPTYDLLPMIKEAIEIKNRQDDSELRIVASAWTAPPWMKDIEDYFIKGTPENNFQGTGGKLKPQYEKTYADYLIRYLKEYKKEGVDIWGITPVNEPHGNNGQWESMHFTPESQNLFIKNYLGPKLVDNGFKNVNLLIYDQNRDGLEHWTDVILGDKETAKYIYGSAVHWYESTKKVYEDVFEKVNAKFPDKAIIHTEGCIDDLGKDAPNGITDPERFKEKQWFDNDSFWWNENATDWGYSALWQGVNSEDHPIYTPVHRYARNIIVSIDHWLKGWIDWNVVLDQRGGPNHVGNFCGAPIMIDTESKHIYYTPIYYLLAQFSRTIRPGDKAVQTEKILDGLDEDALHTCATINDSNLLTVQLLNTTKEPLEFSIQIGDQYAKIKMVPNSVQTIQIQL